ncbi:growth-regulated alpha protein-like [Pygocentrus nattereri]|uniref:Chemokine interleukin-8-like domain-containing protein n=1 Tax=Pygocentrus nattereri TaxID=42514 RepID=A0AAR2IN50_PYGNA|nr:growth-regulated alpha protein-like [Pygocentrus nattereri]
MDSRVVGVCLLLTIFTLTEVCVNVCGLGVEPRCHCSGTESRRIGKLIKTVKFFPPNPHCQEMEIIAKLKNTGREICLDTKALWVMRVIEKIMVNQSP